jgi:uncharacterized membrane protein
MRFYKLSSVAVGIICVLLVSVWVYGLYTDCPDTAIYEYCKK